MEYKKIEFIDIYCFISSTFIDMKTERNILNNNVYGSLKKWCYDIGFNLHFIDLRWGITNVESTINKKTLELCIQKVNESNPIFISLIGQRYGWIPKCDYYSGFMKKYYNKYKGKSATELEILQALDNSFLSGEKKDTIFLFRNDDYLNKIKDISNKNRFIDNKINKVKELKEYLIDKNVEYYDYKVNKIIENNNDIILDSLTINDEEFDQFIISILINKIRKKVEKRILDGKLIYNFFYNDDIIRNYYILNEKAKSYPIKKYDSELLSLLDEEEINYDFTTPKDMGKSSSIARFIKKEYDYNFIIFRFLEDPYYNDLMDIIYSICCEIAVRLNVEFPKNDFEECLNFINNNITDLNNKKIKTILILDDIEKLKFEKKYIYKLISVLSFSHIIITESENDSNLSMNDLKEIVKFNLHKNGKDMSDDLIIKLINNTNGNLRCINLSLSYMYKFALNDNLEELIESIKDKNKIDLFYLFVDNLVKTNMLSMEVLDTYFIVLTCNEYGLPYRVLLETIIFLYLSLEKICFTEELRDKLYTNITFISNLDFVTNTTSFIYINDRDFLSYYRRTISSDLMNLVLFSTLKSSIKILKEIIPKNNIDNAFYNIFLNVFENINIDMLFMCFKDIFYDYKLLSYLLVFINKERMEYLITITLSKLHDNLNINNEKIYRKIYKYYEIFNKYDDISKLINELSKNND